MTFNVDVVARSTPGPVGIGGALPNFKGKVLIAFLKPIGVKTNEVELLVIIEALRIYSRSFHEKLFLESDLFDTFDTISWMSHLEKGPWNF